MGIFNSLRLLAIALPLCLLALSSCQSKSEIQFGTPKRAFSIVNPTEIPLSAATLLLSAQNGSLKNQIKISKSSLGHLYLLSPSMIVSRNYPTLDLLAAKIVYFERVGNQLALMEKRLNAFYEDLGDDAILQSFDIDSESSTDIIFDWRYGLQFLPLKSQWVASDFPIDRSALADSSEPIMPAIDSLVRKAEIKNGALRIEQVTRFRGSQFQISLNSLVSGSPSYISQQDTTVRLFFEIRPYSMNTKFKSKMSILSEGIGYFENLTFEKGTANAKIQATYWDNTVPITYAIAKSVPIKYQNAVKEGILYWNKVHGSPLIKVQMNVDPDQFPEDRTVLVHWAHWDTAGFARANMQHDPITGEIIKGNVYMTSAFTKVENWVERLNQNQSISQSLKRVGLNGLANGNLCEYDLRRKFNNLFGKGLSPVKLTNRLIQDIVREVVAHEVGHTLGLRHNFAASQDTEFNKFSEFETARDSYIEDKLPKGAAVSASVMDYNSHFAGAMLGVHIKHHSLPYDEMAIEWAYDKQTSLVKNDKYSFCSDGELSAHSPLGCTVFDVGPQLFGQTQEDLQQTRDTVMFAFFNSVLLRVFAKNLDQRQEMHIAIQEIAETPLKRIAKSVVSPLFSAMTALLEGRQILHINKRLGRPSWLNEEKYSSAADLYLGDELKLVGGLRGLIESALPYKNKTIQAGWLKMQAESIIQSDIFTEGKTLEGIKYKLSSDQRKKMAQFIRSAAEKFEPEYIGAIISSIIPDESRENRSASMLSATPVKKSIYKKRLSSDWEPVLGELALKVFERRRPIRSVRNGAKTMRYEPAFYSAELRKLASGLFNQHAFGKSPNWMRSERKKSYRSVIQPLEKLLLQSGPAEKFESALNSAEFDDQTYRQILREISLSKIFERNKSWDF